MKDGNGMEKYSDGSIYEGGFKNNLRHGKGTLILDKTGIQKYIGEFKNDKISGKGRYIRSELKEYIGEWDNNQVSGYGMLKDGNILYFGFFLSDKKNGYGACFYDVINMVIIGKWENDLIQGFAIVINYNDNGEDNNENSSEKIVKMCNGEISDTKLDDENINTFKKSNDYAKMTKLFKEKFYPDYKLYIN